MSIKANQLRIGNWVLDEENKPYKWEASDFGVFVPDSDECDYFSPMALTWEQLKELKVDYTVKSAATSYLSHDPKIYTLHLNVEGWVSPPLTYVHQLQNLYFLIHGKEININF